jgi:cysteinyl-tRNA synthetase
MKLFNTLSRKKEELYTLKPNKINFFVCGPTVYDYSHLGHAKTYVQFDLIVKYLRYKGYKVNYIMNITDIDDKIIKRGNERKIDPLKLAKEYEKIFYEDMKSLGIDSITKFARSMDYIKQIIKQIKELMDKGYAYETSDGIYFEISKFKEYGKLSKQPLDKIKSGARVAVNEDKKDPADFVLWKKQKPGEPAWDSPWGKGRPGWHIEDTAITEKEFGPQYDVHGGAIDLIFPHHESEIAQMESASGKKPLVRYWLHIAFLNINKEKMAKSLGNFMTIREALKKVDGKTLRYLFATNHYRTPINFEPKILEQCENSLERLNNFIQDLYHKKGSGESKKIDSYIEKVKVDFEHYMDNDFDTPRATAIIFDFIRDVNKLDVSKKDAEKIIKLIKDLDKVFGIFSFEKTTIPAGINKLADEREKARKNKDWKKADSLRVSIKKKGYLVEDTKEGYKIKKI